MIGSCAIDDCMRKGQFAAVPTEDDNGTDGHLSGHRLSSASVTQLEMAGTTPTTASYSTQRIVHAWVQPEPLERVILRRAMKVLVIFSLLCFLASKLLAGTHSPPMKPEIADAYRTAMVNSLVVDMDASSVPPMMRNFFVTCIPPMPRHRKVGLFVGGVRPIQRRRRSRYFRQRLARPSSRSERLKSI